MTGAAMSFTTDMADSGESLSRALRAIRRKRGLKTSEVARRMAMAQRSYELFEAGGGRITFERLMSFAEATDCDPFALMLVGPFGSAEFAIHCADTKLAMIMVMSLQEFAEDRGADLCFLEPPNIIAAFQRLFKDLGGRLDDNEAFLSKWLDGRTGMIDLGALSMRGLRRRKA
ncbi:helix-turn-helix transcriptional regulator [Sphingobium sp.]|uniref:helix-turn-helix domain-containing protein n=1 Tax=Sphingobium sp. TaxID=1912891 RepID=UPI00257CE4CD|nr:helix-turn-helix transcriptional regulator [Sphingobium sp.]